MKDKDFEINSENFIKRKGAVNSFDKDDKYSSNEFSDEYIGAPCGTEDYLERKSKSFTSDFVFDPNWRLSSDGKLHTININSDNLNTFGYDCSVDSKIDLSALVPAKKETKTYRPLPSCLTIKESNIEGLGLFASKDIYLLDVRDPKDWCSHINLNYEHYSGDAVNELIRSGLGAYVNQSKFPNCTIREFFAHTNSSLGFSIQKYYLRPLRDIKEGEEILVDYTKELCGLIEDNGAKFSYNLKRGSSFGLRIKDVQRYLPIEDRVYQGLHGSKYYYNSVYGLYRIDFPKGDNCVFYTPEDAEKYLQRIE